MPFCSDIEKASMKGDGDRQTREDKRSRIKQSHPKIVRRAESPRAKNFENVPWVLSGNPCNGQSEAKACDDGEDGLEKTRQSHSRCSSRRKQAPYSFATTFRTR